MLVEEVLLVDNDTFIKLFRSFTSWEWYTDQNTKDVFIHCLLMANWKDKKWKGTMIPRGSFVTSYSKIAKEIGISVQQARTAISNLKSTHDITTKSTNKYTLITIEKYSVWQNNNEVATSKITSNSTSKQHSNNKQSTTTKEDKNTIEDKRYKIKDKSTCVHKLKIHYLTERLLNKNLIAENETEIFDEIIREYLAEYDAVDVSVKADYVLGLMKGKRIDNRMAYFKSAMNKNLKYSYLPEAEDTNTPVFDEEVDLDELDEFLAEFE